jgi:hypothetical protein
LKGLLREPLLQFLVLAAVLFGINAYLTRGAEEAPAKIVVTTAQIDSLAKTFAMTWQRQPTPEELDGLVEDYIRDEVYYREGKAIGVDRDDIVIRRRIRQKMEFFAEDMAAAEPTDAELAAYLSDHVDDFRRDDKVSFQHLYLSESKRGETLDDDARLVSAELLGRTEVDRMPTSDGFLLGNDFENVTRADVARDFGEAFAAKLFEAAQGVWEGPVASPFGLHFVFVRDRGEGGTPRLEEAREAVEREFLNERRNKVQEAFYQNLRKRYEVVIEQAPGEADRQMGALP